MEEQMPCRVLLALALVFSFTSMTSNGAQRNTPFNKETHETPGSLSGTVRTNRNEPVKDVRIELAPVAGTTGRAASTYSALDGSFAFSNLAYGTYMLTA